VSESVKVNAAGFQTTLTRVRARAGGSLKYLEGLVKDIAQTILFPQLLQNIALVDGHTQEVLDELDNPYASRHEPGFAEGALGHDKNQVHKQSGTLLGALRDFPETIDTGRTVIVRYVYGLDMGACPYAEEVIHGNSKMIPRDPGGLTMGQVQGAITQEMQDKGRFVYKTLAVGSGGV